MNEALTVAIVAAATTRSTRMDIRVAMPCTPMSVRTVRHIVGALAAGCPRLDDLLLITSELVTCGIRSQPWSADDAVAVSVVIGDYLAQVTVAQGLAPGHKRGVDGGFGRAMLVVHSVADVCHHRTLSGRARTSAEVKR